MEKKKHALSTFLTTVGNCGLLSSNVELLGIQWLIWFSEPGTGPEELSLQIPAIKSANESHANTKLLMLSRGERLCTFLVNGGLKNKEGQINPITLCFSYSLESRQRVYFFTINIQNTSLINAI